MKEYGLIGHPLGHSFSKKFFTAGGIVTNHDNSINHHSRKQKQNQVDQIYSHPFAEPDGDSGNRLGYHHVDLIGIYIVRHDVTSQPERGKCENNTDRPQAVKQ